MFWRPVASGFGMLRRWQVWGAGLVYAQITDSCSSLLDAYGTDPDTDELRSGPSLIALFGPPLVRSMLGAVLIVWLFPLMLGGPQAAPTALMLRAAGTILLSALLAFGVVAVLHFVPLVDEVASRPQISALVLDVVLFRLLSARVLMAWASQVGIVLSTRPGFWGCVGYLAIALTTVKVAQTATAMLLDRTGILRRDELAPVLRPALSLLLPTLDLLGGLLPIFIYVRHAVLAPRA